MNRATVRVSLIGELYDCVLPHEFRVPRGLFRRWTARPRPQADRRCGVRSVRDPLGSRCPRTRFRIGSTQGAVVRRARRFRQHRRGAWVYASSRYRRAADARGQEPRRDAGRKGARPSPGRGNAQAQAGKALRPLFADAIAEGKRFYNAHGYVPANHMYMVRGRLAREHPALVANLYRAFHESKTLAQQSLPRETPRGLLFGNEQLARTCESFVGDPFSYGIDSNRTMLETVVQLCQEQGLVRDKPSIEQLFVPGSE